MRSPPRFQEDEARDTDPAMPRPIALRLSIFNLHPEMSAISDNHHLCLPGNYRSRIESIYYRDQIVQGTIWQPEVYDWAKHICSNLMFSPRKIVDIGCGNGSRIASLHPDFRVSGVDHGENLEHARRNHPEISWIEANLERDLEFLQASLEQSLVICSDVIEHLANPQPLLELFRQSQRHIYGIVISTPDRIRARGLEDQGPPANPSHVREWAMEEFFVLLCKAGLKPFLHGHTRNISSSSSRNTQVAFIPGEMARINPNASRPTALAIVPCYNEIDIIEKVIVSLLSQGLDVHLIDNWSNDGSWELVNARFEGLVRTERFPDRPVNMYCWKDILDRMDTIAATSPHDWILHVDADEFFESPSLNHGLLEFIGVADEAGYDMIEATLLDFRPVDGQSMSQLSSMWQFATRPGAFTLQRAWKNRRHKVGISQTGGHSLSVPYRRFPFNLILKHYPLRSPDQAKTKIFHDRNPRFAKERAELGWHVQYDAYLPEHTYLWDPSLLNNWEWITPREYIVELSSRAGIEQATHALPNGLL
jgi:2-polyprenyl-3-methyl-5-hydroxy-6-metoxy-1,4-benzoquinol methylase/glycosyltransferase involved in cell wall biosynthesis